MAIKDYKINKQNRTIQDLADRPAENNLSAQELKEKFDYFPELLRQKHNSLIDEIEESFAKKAEIEPLGNNIKAYSEHLYYEATSDTPGHIKIDNQTLSLNEKGQLAVVGGGEGGRAATYDEAIEGLDNTKIMTPLRVKEAIEKDREKAFLEPEVLLQEYQPVTAFAWDIWGSFLGVGLEIGSPSQHYVAIWGINNNQFYEYSRIAVGGKVLQIGFCPLGMSLAIRYLDKTDGASKVAVIKVNGNVLEGLSVLNMPNGAADLAWNPFLGSGGASVLAVVNPGISGKVYIAMIRRGAYLGLAAYTTQTQLPWKKVCFNTKTRHFITLAGEDNGRDKIVVEMTSDSSPVSTLIASYISLGTVSGMAWRRYGRELALAYASASQDVQGEILAFSSAPASLEAVFQLNSSGGGHNPSGCVWRGDGAYLAYIYNYFQTAANICFYRYLDGGLYYKAGKNLNADNCNFAWHPEGLLCMGIGSSRLSEAQELYLMELRDKENSFYFGQSASFIAAPGLFYRVKRPQGAEKICITCFNNPKNGEYFRFMGKYPEDIEINSGNSDLEGEIQPREAGAASPGLFEVIYASDGQTSIWTVKRLSLGLATKEEAKAAQDDTAAMTLFTTGLAIEERSKRGATYIIAAADSLKKEGADFICSGEGDHLIIQEAINALPAGGGKLLFKEGTYNFDCSERAYPSSQKLYLAEAEQGSIIFEGTGVATIFRLGDNCLEEGKTIALFKCGGDNKQFKNILFEGNKNGNNPLGFSEAVFFPSGGAFNRLNNCRIKNFSGHGLNNGSVNLSLSQCVFEGCQNGVYNFGYGVNISDCSFLNNAAGGIYLSACNGFNLRCNYFFENIQNGIKMESSSNGICLGNMIIGSKEGIKAGYGNSCLLQGNFIRRNPSGGQYAPGESSILLEDCTNFMVLFNDCLHKAVEEDENSDGTILAFSGDNWNRA